MFTRKDKKQLIVIPVFKPDSKLLEITERLSSEGWIIIVVDDGNGEKYKNILNEVQKTRNLILLRHLENKGKGCALKTGFKYVKESYKNYDVITVDADGQHEVHDINNVAQKKDVSEEETIVFGVRKFDKNTPLKSKIGNYITSFLIKIFYGESCIDTQTGLRRIPYSLIDSALNIKGERYEYEMNFLIWALNHKKRIEYVPIKTIYLNGNKGSSFRFIADSFKVYSAFIKFLVIGLSSFALDYSLFIILYFYGFSILQALVSSRIVSSIYNYHMSKKLFGVDKGLMFFNVYVLNILLLLILSYSLVSIFVYFGGEVYLGKIFVDAILVVISFLVQRKAASCLR